MSTNTINVSPDGPYRVEGSVTLIDSAGKPYEQAKTIFLCRCGQSASKPFCDGTHKQIGFESKVSATAN